MESLRWAARPLARPDQPSFHRSGAFAGSRRLVHPPAAIARAEVGYPDLRCSDTFCRRRVTRGAGGADRVGGASRTPFYVPTKQARFRVAHRRVPRSRKTSQQGGFPRFPAKGAELDTPKVPSIVGCSSWEGYLRGVFHRLLRGPIRRSEALNVRLYASHFLPSLGPLATPAEHPLTGEPAKSSLDPWEGGRLSTGCSEPVDISPAPFQPLPFEQRHDGRARARARVLDSCSGPEALEENRDRSAPYDFCAQDDPRLR